MTNALRSIPQWIQSALTTFIAIAGVVAAAAAAGDLSIPAGWVAGIATAAAVARTILGALNPGNTGYGIGANDDTVD